MQLVNHNLYFMGFSKKELQKLEEALGNRVLKERFLDELQLLRDAFQALLAKLDADAAILGRSSDYEKTLSLGPIRDEED